METQVINLFCDEQISQMLQFTFRY